MHQSCRQVELKDNSGLCKKCCGCCWVPILITTFTPPSPQKCCGCCWVPIFITTFTPPSPQKCCGCCWVPILITTFTPPSPPEVLWLLLGSHSHNNIHSPLPPEVLWLLLGSHSHIIYSPQTHPLQQTSAECIHGCGMPPLLLFPPSPPPCKPQQNVSMAAVWGTGVSVHMTLWSFIRPAL